MYSYFKISVILLLLTTLFHKLSAQEIVNTKGTAQVRLEMNRTMEETRDEAKQLAIINAIENAFGTYAEQQMDMTIKDGQTSYNIIGTTKVKGDWIETTKIDYTEEINTENTKYGKSQILYITCEIRGKARKITPRAQLVYEILNAPNLLARTTNFYHEEQLYLFFKSPVDGYLSVFLEDDEAVYRLLPYMNMVDEYQSGVPIKGDQDYLFFSPNDNAYPGNAVDEPRLLTLKDGVEYNNVYIVFSTDEFVKPMLNNSTVIEGRIIPKQLTHYNFEKWITDNSISSANFQVIKRKIGIEQKN